MEKQLRVGSGAQAIRELTPCSINTEMGRGRSGITDQSMKKPKIGKNKRRGTNFEIFNPPYKQENNSLVLLDDVITQMKKMSPQDLMNILLPNQSEQNH